MSFQRDRNSRGLSFALKPAGTRKMYNWKPSAKEASLYVTGLSDQVCEQDLDKYFQDICKVSRIKIAPKKEGMKTRVAFISLCNAGELDKAIQASNGRYIVDSKIKVCAAKEKATGGTAPHRPSGSSSGDGSTHGPVVRRNDSGPPSFHNGAARFSPPASRSGASHGQVYRELTRNPQMRRGDSYYGPASAASATAVRHQVDGSPYQSVSRFSAGRGGTSSAHRYTHHPEPTQSMSGARARPATGGKLAAQFNKLRAATDSATLTTGWHEPIQAFIDKKGLPRQAYNVVPTERVFEKKWCGRQPLPPAYTLIQPSDPILSTTSTTGSVSTTDTLTSLTTSPPPRGSTNNGNGTDTSNRGLSGRESSGQLLQSAGSGSGHSDQESGSTTDPKHHKRCSSPATAVTPALCAYSTAGYRGTSTAYGEHSSRVLPVKGGVGDSAHTSGSGWMACGVKRSSAAVDNDNDYYGPSIGGGQQYGRNQRVFC